MIDHIPLDVHVGSIAIKRFIEAKQPMLTLHGHVHESTRLTGNWQQHIGNTFGPTIDMFDSKLGSCRDQSLNTC